MIKNKTYLKNKKNNYKILFSFLIFFVFMINLFSSVIFFDNQATGDAGDGFNIKDKTLVKYNGIATSVTIPVQIETIAPGAFRDNAVIVEVILNVNTTEIKQNAFYNCTNLKNFTIPRNSKLQKIYAFAFARCERLREINFPEGLLEIGEFAFFANSQLQEVVFPENLKTIKEHAFMSCINVKKFEIGKGTTDIGLGVFNYCVRNTAINVAFENQNYFSSNGVLYSKDKSILIRYPAGKTLNEFEVVVPIKTVQRMAFWDNRYLTNLFFPTTLEEWLEGAINDKSENQSIKKIVVPNRPYIKRTEALACKMCPNLIVEYKD